LAAELPDALALADALTLAFAPVLVLAAPLPGRFTVTVTWVAAGNPTVGVNTAVSPTRCQDPATAGDSVGSGADAGSGWL
jgi:hypothetical protein